MLEPKVEYINYYTQKLELNNNIIIENIFESSHEVCYYGVTKIIRNGKEDILIDFPHTDDLYIKGCAIDIKYINSNTVEFPICYVGGAGSGECSVAFMRYNIETMKWLYLGSEDFYAGEDEYSFFSKLLLPFFQIIYLLDFKTEEGKTDYSFLGGFLTGKSINDTMQEKYFDVSFYKFINYFNENYTLENFNDFNEIYKSKENFLNKEDKKVILNTIHYFLDKNIDYGMMNNSFDEKILLYSNKGLNENDKKILAKLQFIQSLKIYSFKDHLYDESIGFDLEIKNKIEQILKR